MSIANLHFSLIYTHMNHLLYPSKIFSGKQFKKNILQPLPKALRRLPG